MTETCLVNQKPHEGGRIETLVLQEGVFCFDPPGLDVPVAELFPEP